ncbi:ferrochelatase [Acrasis kona]|uniref:Ferrochelatase n=1 Tax=Acrasis kona TaxID=1008807 RepID=A0AAW2Z9W6_9EUKA
MEVTIKVHSFPMDELIIFAKYKEQKGGWLAWRKRKDEQSAREDVYYLRDEQKTRPPSIVSSNLKELIVGICDGSVVQQIKDEFTEIVEESDSDSDSEEGRVEEELISFTPHSAPKSFLEEDGPPLPESERTSTNSINSLLLGVADKFNVNSSVQEDEEDWSD